MSLPDEYREIAKQQISAAQSLLESPDVLTKADKLVPCIAGFVQAHMYNALADVMEYQRGTTRIDKRAEQLRTIEQHASAIRSAAAQGAATGDWNEFDRLAAGGEPADTT